MKGLKFRGLVENISTGNRSWVYYGVGSKPSLCGMVWLVENEQFIGKRDKAGNEIYENDRVLVLYTDWSSKPENDKRTLEEYLDGISHIGVVKYDESKARFGVLFGNSEYIDDINVEPHGRIKVIGYAGLS